MYAIRIGHATLVVRVQGDRIDHWVLFVVKPVCTAMLVIFNAHNRTCLVIFNAHSRTCLVISNAHCNTSIIQGRQWVAKLSGNTWKGAKHVNVHPNYGIVTKAQQPRICKQLTTNPPTYMFSGQKEGERAPFLCKVDSFVFVFARPFHGFIFGGEKHVLISLQSDAPSLQSDEV